MDDLTWLAGRTIAFAADAPLAAAAELPQPAPSAVVADPTRVQAYASRVPDGVAVIAVAGYPTGRHHTLVKAAEARLALQSGADEVWVCVDSFVSDENALLADLVAMRDACPAPARMGLLLPEAASASAAQFASSYETASTAAVGSTSATTSSAGADALVLANLAAKAGYDRLIVGAAGAEQQHEWPLETVALVPGASTEDVIAQLDAGASYVAL